MNIIFGQSGPSKLHPVQTTDTFAQAEGDLFVVVRAGSFPVQVQIENDPTAYSWAIERDPAEPAGNLPAIVGSPGSQISFLPNTTGNFRLLTRLGPTVVSIAPLAIVGAELIAVNMGAGRHHLRPAFLNADFSMSLEANYRLIGGGASRTLGTSFITLGNVGNLTMDNVVIPYPAAGGHAGGTGSDAAQHPLPVLDTARKSTDPEFPLRCASDFNTIGSCQSLGQGACVRVTSADYPHFPFCATHPATGAPVGQPRGSLTFIDYIVGRSKSFPTSVVPILQQTWQATPDFGFLGITPATPVVKTDVKLTLPVADRTVIYDPPAAGCKKKVVPRVKEATAPDLAAFALGQLTGEALTGEADVLLGSLQSSPPPDHADSIGMKIDKVVWGAHELSDAIDLPYAPFGTAPGSGDPLAQAWSHVGPALTSQVLAIRTRRQLQVFAPFDPVLVTSRAEEIEQVLRLTDYYRPIQSTADVAAAVDQLQKNPDPLLGGLIYSRIWYVEALSDPTLATRLMLQLIGSASIPAVAWMEVAQDIALSFLLIAASAQQAVIAHFAEMAQQADRDAALAGLHGFARIASFTELKLDPAVQASVWKAYRYWIDQGAMLKDCQLETQLGL
jgi:hypothetical protein